jgi:predicted DCC family thiol-disulfide oxidoreductase YuxK
VTISRLTVLYDEDCAVCRAGRRWLGRQRTLVPMAFVPAGSRHARELFPALDHEATLRDVTVVDDNGGVYVADDAWLICLWALERYRLLAIRLAEPGLRPLARRVVAGASAIRRRTSGAGYGADCDDRCPVP